MHSFRFYRAGGVDQVRLDTGADIANLKHLDQKLWVALSCPVKGLELDEKTLAMIDSDHDGRVRVGELLTAIAFCEGTLKSLDSLIKGGDELPLDLLDATKPEGAKILASAKEILKGIGKAETPRIALSDVADTNAVLAQAVFNGDGVVVEAAMRSDVGKAVHRSILSTIGGVKDAGGAEGVGAQQIEQFFQEAQLLVDWYTKAESQTAELLPLGQKTPAAYAAVMAVKTKVDDFFARCRVATFDPRAAVAIQGMETDLAAIVAKGLSADAAELAAFPLARPSPGAALPLAGPVNPAWASAMATLRAATVDLILGERESLTESDWAGIQAKLAGFGAYAVSKPVTKIESLGLPKLREIIASSARAELDAAVAEDKLYEAHFKDIGNVERLIRYHRDLYRLLNNFVSFADFYDPAYPATFQVGRLYLDSRACELCIGVDDVGRHAAMAGYSKCFLAYCDIVRKGGTEKRQIVAVFTNGDSDFLTVGRNGLFYDRNGGDWDATVTKIVDNPISVRQAFWSPYKKFLKMIEELIAKRAAAADEAANARVAAAATSAAGVAPAPVAPPKKFDPAVVAMVGVAVGGISTALSAALAVFLGLGKWIPLAILGIVLVISGPSMFLAWFKLRQRNLGPILEANGWAINSRAKVNAVFGATMTQLPAFPPGSRRTLIDPFAQKPRLATRLVQVAVPMVFVAGATVGVYHLGFLPDVMESRISFLGVPQYLKTKVDIAQKRLDEKQQAWSQTDVAYKAAKADLETLKTALKKADDASSAAAIDNAKPEKDRVELATIAAAVKKDKDRAEIRERKAAATRDKAQLKLDLAQREFDEADDALLKAEKLELPPSVTSAGSLPIPASSVVPASAAH